MKRITLIIIGTLMAFTVWAQGTVSLRGSVKDAQSKQALPFATVRLQNVQKKIFGAVSAADGTFLFPQVPQGKYTLIVSYIGYNVLQKEITLHEGENLQLLWLTEESTGLKEVVVTASESKGITSASRIDRTSMEHLQPSSFTDLLALLPGHMSSTPVMNSANVIRLRETGSRSGDYNTTSLGTQFVVDGVPMSTDANLQRVLSDPTTLSTGRNTVNAGVDMRTIPTDNIESVEVVRGIPSVEYSDLTSGVVIIKRKLTATPWEARFKADEYGKLFSAGKGFQWQGERLTLFADLSYLDSKADPRNTQENYQRITASLRLQKDWQWETGHALRYHTALDYAGNVDKDKTDPDIHTLPEENISVSYQRGNWSHQFRWSTPQHWMLRSVEANLSATVSWDVIKRTRFVSPGIDRVAPTYTEEGEYDGEILPYEYLANIRVEGKPINLYAQLKAKFRNRMGLLVHNWQVGTKFRSNKNWGDGSVYDPSRPLSWTNSTRPRRYKDIPAQDQWSIYAEDKMLLPIGAHTLEAEAGALLSTLTNLGKEYSMAGKFYADLRLNVAWKLPAIKIGQDELRLQLSAGAGSLTKMPTLAHLYPETVYTDLVQLNYWHSNPDYRRIHLRTYVNNPTNYNIRPAQNKKWEVRLSAEYKGNNFSVTYFRERLNNGFRSESQVIARTYKKYDTSGINSATLTAPPDLATLPYTEETILRLYGQYANGSRTDKQGIEYQISTKRFRGINTRFTLNGAWFLTRYENSVPQFYKHSTPVVNGVVVTDKFVGLYENVDLSRKEQLNTNLTVDTYVPKLGLKFSLTAEAMWFTSSKQEPRSETPTYYLDTDMVLHPYTEASKQDTYLQHLNYSATGYFYAKSTVPFYAVFNFKATKDFGRYMTLSLFANRLLDYTPDYTRNGVLIRRSSPNAYFGMEINFKL